MKNLSKLMIVLLILSAQTFAQTKLIAWKSHSGSAKNFKAYFFKKLFDYRSSNCGGAPEPYITTAVLDSVIYISNNKSLMITSSYCGKPGHFGSVWKAGRDTVYNHPLFTHQHSLDSIKTILKEYYYFKNPVDEVRFVGFDNQKEKTIERPQEISRTEVIKPEAEKRTYRPSKKTKKVKPLKLNNGLHKMGLRAKKIFSHKKCKSCPHF